METTRDQLNQVMQEASQAWRVYRKSSGTERAKFLRAIASQIEALGQELITTASEESHLPEARITGERGRTCAQLRMFADFVEDGSWAPEMKEEAQPDRTPQPKPSLRRSWVSVGPVAVFGASNFPLAFSTAGGDTASALAAGCTVVVKAHDAHPKTNAMVAGAIQRAANETGLPKGVFATVYGGHDLGQHLVTHPLTASVAFTGSFKGGKALWDIANQRLNPIPVFAEMGSINPVFLMPHRLEIEGAELARQLGGSVCLGVGQFCTNPGLLVAVDSETSRKFVQQLANSMSEQKLGQMLTDGIRQNYEAKLKEVGSRPGVHMVASMSSKFQGPNSVIASVRVTTGDTFLADTSLQEEVFGPFTLVVMCKDQNQMAYVAESLQGQLTATLMATELDLLENGELVDILETKAGRIILNGVPTGVEVSPAMQHGGPWPATSDGRFTSVGTAAIWRFVRPVCWQGWA